MNKCKPELSNEEWIGWVKDLKSVSCNIRSDRKRHHLPLGQEKGVVAFYAPRGRKQGWTYWPMPESLNIPICSLERGEKKRMKIKLQKAQNFEDGGVSLEIKRGTKRMNIMPGSAEFLRSGDLICLRRENVSKVSFLYRNVEEEEEESLKKEKWTREENRARQVIDEEVLRRMSLLGLLLEKDHKIKGINETR